jgi:hypothetical protein
VYLSKKRNVGVYTLILLMTLLASTLFSGGVAAQSEAPFTISIEPKTASAEAGEEVAYTLQIEAQDGFEGSISLVLEITALGYGATLDLGSHGPPYPKEFTRGVTLPPDVPGGVTAQGVLTATSGEFVQEEVVEIKIKSSGRGGLLEWLLRTLSELWNRIISIFSR